MKLSERMRGKTGWGYPITDEHIEGWADEVAKLEEENDRLQDALYHSGYDWTDCIDCGGPPHNEYCRFLKLRHLFPLWFEGQESE